VRPSPTCTERKRRRGGLPGLRGQGRIPAAFREAREGRRVAGGCYRGPPGHVFGEKGGTVPSGPAARTVSPATVLKKKKAGLPQRSLKTRRNEPQHRKKEDRPSSKRPRIRYPRKEKKGSRPLRRQRKRRGGGCLPSPVIGRFISFRKEEKPHVTSYTTVFNRSFPSSTPAIYDLHEKKKKRPLFPHPLGVGKTSRTSPTGISKKKKKNPGRDGACPATGGKEKGRARAAARRGGKGLAFSRSQRPWFPAGWKKRGPERAGRPGRTARLTRA